MDVKIEFITNDPYKRPSPSSEVRIEIACTLNHVANLGNINEKIAEVFELLYLERSPDKEKEYYRKLLTTPSAYR